MSSLTRRYNHHSYNAKNKQGVSIPHRMLSKKKDKRWLSDKPFYTLTGYLFEADKSE